MLFPCQVHSEKSRSLRKKASSFAFAVYDSVAMINTEHWNKIARGSSEFLSLTYLTVLENTSPENMRFHYSIIYENKNPVAIAYFQVIDFSSENYGSNADDSKADICELSGYLKKYLTQHLKRHADHLNMRMLVCGNALVSGEHGFAFIPEVNKAEIFNALADVMYRIGRAEKLRGKIAAVIVKDFYDATKMAANELKEFKYYDFLVEPNMIVDINWRTFDDYLNAMSKKYRNRTKGIIKKGGDLEQRNFNEEDIRLYAREIQALHNNVHYKAKFRLASMTSGYFAEMKKSLGDKFIFSAYYYKDKLVGFKTSFILRDSIEAHFIGLDYSVNKELEIYQNILYDYVREAIANNALRLHLGRTASEIKSTVGAEPHALTCYIRHRNPLSNRIIKPFIDNLKPSEWIPRNPFKESLTLELS